MIKLYGISNCDSVRKARQWLDNHQLEYQFHDFKLQAPDYELLQSWVNELGWQALLNKRSTTWRQQPEAVKTSIKDSTQAIELMQANPTLIKRPLLETNKGLGVGFVASNYSRLCTD